MAKFQPNRFPDQLKRMKAGKALLVFDEGLQRTVSAELHHTQPQRGGGLFTVEIVTPTEHAARDFFRHTGR